MTRRFSQEEVEALSDLLLPGVLAAVRQELNLPWDGDMPSPSAIDPNVEQARVLRTPRAQMEQKPKCTPRVAQV